MIPFSSPVGFHVIDMCTGSLLNRYSIHIEIFINFWLNRTVNRLFLFPKRHQHCYGLANSTNIKDATENSNINKIQITQWMNIKLYILNKDFWENQDNLLIFVYNKDINRKYRNLVQQMEITIKPNQNRVFIL